MMRPSTAEALALAVAGLAAAFWLGARVEVVGGRPLDWLLGDDPGVYDPHATSSPIAESIFSFACEPLVTDAPDGRLRGVLVEDDIRVSADGRQIALRLRDGIRFHDGSPVDAAAVAASFAHLQHLGVSPLGEELRTVAFLPGATPRDVIVQLPHPDPDFARLVLANPYAAIVRPPAAHDDGGTGDSGAGGAGRDNGGGSADDTEPPGLPVCTGPYRFDPALYTPGRAIALDGVRSYRHHAVGAERAGPASIPRLRFTFESDRDARLERLLWGDACVLSLSDTHLPLLDGRAGYRLHSATGGLTYLGFNFQRPRWQSATARRAVAHALDPAAMAATGPFRTALTPLLPGALGYDAAVGAARPATDAARARRMLAAAGITADMPIVLLTAEGETYRRLAEAVVIQLVDVGLRDVRVRAVPRDDIASRRQDFDLLLYDYAWSDYTALGIFLGPGPRNLLGYADDDIAALVAAARVASNETDRTDRLRAAQRRIMADAIWVPLVVRDITLAVKATCVSGEVRSPDGHIWWHEARTAGAGMPAARVSDDVVGGGPSDPSEPTVGNEPVP